jgi:hypothetical protein
MRCDTWRLRVEDLQMSKTSTRYSVNNQSLLHCRTPAYVESKAEITEPWMIVGTAAKRPMKLPLRFVNR